MASGPTVVCSHCRHDVPMKRSGCDVVAAVHNVPCSDCPCPGSDSKPLDRVPNNSRDPEQEVRDTARELGRRAAELQADREELVQILRTAFNEEAERKGTQLGGGRGRGQ